MNRRHVLVAGVVLVAGGCASASPAPVSVHHVVYTVISASADPFVILQTDPRLGAASLQPQGLTAGTHAFAYDFLSKATVRIAVNPKTVGGGPVTCTITDNGKTVDTMTGPEGVSCLGST